MKQTISTNEAAHQLYNDENAGWSFKGATALAEYLEELEEETGGEMEFNRVDVRCEYSQYESLEEAFRAYCYHPTDYIKEMLEEELWEDEDSLEELRLHFFSDRTLVLQFEGGVILRDY